MQKIFLILGVACFQVALGVVSEDDLRSSHKQCLSEFNVSADAFLQHVNADWTVTEGDPDVNGISLCIYRLENLLKNDDSLDEDKYRDDLVNKYFVKRNFHFDNFTEVATNGLEACKSVQGSDPGDKLVKHHNCIINYLKTVV